MVRNHDGKKFHYPQVCLDASTPYSIVFLHSKLVNRHSHALQALADSMNRAKSKILQRRVRRDPQRFQPRSSHSTTPFRLSNELSACSPRPFDFYEEELPGI